MYTVNTAIDIVLSVRENTVYPVTEIVYTLSKKVRILYIQLHRTLHTYLEKILCDTDIRYPAIEIVYTIRENVWILCIQLYRTLHI